MLILWCDFRASDERVHSKMNFFTVLQPKRLTGHGLFESFLDGIPSLGIPSLEAGSCKKLVGIATDGAAANIAAAGFKGYVEENINWVFWTWCLAHRLELSIKDALKGTWFNDIDSMLLQLYYIYERSPKKCRELEDIITDLKECLEFDDAGVRPIRASGTRWICHKLSAMRRVLSKYGAYTSHIAALSVDTSLKPADRAKLQGYYKQWTNSKYLIGCAVFTDILSPCAIFSKCMQTEELDILGALTSLLRTVRETNQLGSKPIEQWPTYSSVMNKIKEEDGDHVYQMQALKRFDLAKTHFDSPKCAELCLKVTTCIKDRLEWSDLDLMRDIIFFLSTHGWQKIVEELDVTGSPHDDDPVDSPLVPIDRLVKHFEVPLEGAGAESIKKSLHANCPTKY